jgi:hypothetical protein
VRHAHLKYQRAGGQPDDQIDALAQTVIEGIAELAIRQRDGCRCTITRPIANRVNGHAKQWHVQARTTQAGAAHTVEPNPRCLAEQVHASSLRTASMNT